jgi:hypothetical protein
MPCIERVKPLGEHANCTQAMRPSVVVGLAERNFPAQEQCRTDMSGVLGIRKGHQLAQDPLVRGEAVPQTAPDAQVTVEFFG